MKQPWEWDEDDILKLIENKVSESLTLDYKECGSLQKKDSKKLEISKDVSSFANSAGGTIIYGVIEDKVYPTAIDAGFDPLILSKEWLENVISSNISQRIDGIRINQIDLSKSNPGSVIYVVNIPQSNRAPHMAADKRYYKRFNSQSVPMEDYEVKDVSRRLEAPDLEIEFDLYNDKIVSKLIENLEGNVKEEHNELSLTATIKNHSLVPAEYVSVDLYIDASIECYVKGGYYIGNERAPTVRNITIEKDARNYSFTGMTYVFGGLNTPPVWKGYDAFVSNKAIALKLPLISGKGLLLGCRISSPKMEPKYQFYNIVLDGALYSLIETDL